MCASAWVPRPGRGTVQANSYGELRRLLGWRPPTTWPERPIPDQECLCHVDWPKLSRLADWCWRWDSWGDVRLTDEPPCGLCGAREKCSMCCHLEEAADRA